MPCERCGAVEADKLTFVVTPWQHRFHEAWADLALCKPCQDALDKLVTAFRKESVDGRAEDRDAGGPRGPGRAEAEGP